MCNYIPKKGQPKGKDKFLKRHDLPSLNQEETENMSRPIPSNEIESVI